MAGTFPRWRLYDSTGAVLVYEFLNVVDWGDSPFLDPVTYVEHNSLRGQGSIISNGSTEPWDLTLQFVLTGADYEAVVALINTIPTTIVKNTKYILKVDLTTSTTKDLKVKRIALDSLRFPSTGRSKKIVNFADAYIKFRVNCWA